MTLAQAASGAPAVVTPTLVTPALVTPSGSTGRVLRRAMDGLYWLCVGIAGAALVLISAVVPWAVYTRYVLNRAASWPEPAAVLLTIVLTFFGAAACYRLQLHMNVSALVRLFPPAGQRICAILAELLMALVASFMVVWGGSLVTTTWQNSISEFPFLPVGLTYLPIPVGGAILFLFVLERLLLGPPPAAAAEHGMAAFE